VIILVIFYVILGCFMDALSMVLLTIPVVFPLIHALQIDRSGSAS
jgi:TRAP-type C4-dicarboxylate transport system permease large subunit